MKARLSALAIAGALTVLVGAQQPGPRSPIVVQGAMPSETERFVSRLEHATPERAGGWTFWRGDIDGYPVIVSRTLKGMENAGAATAIAIERFHPAAIINQGTAGGHDPSLHLYDIVLGVTAVNIGSFRSPVREKGRGTNPLQWMPLNLMASEGSAGYDPNARRVAKFDGDARLLATARGVKSYAKGRVVDGVIGSSNIWNDELDLIARYHADFGTSVEEMETASAAQISGLYGVPFLGIRVVSDNATNGGAYDGKTGEACEDFVFDVVRAYVTSLRR
ncbi:MAG TPA: 5'-methylthioadenosine/S-adenosylhomocysteine nucleosidase [Vicinamibacterales bacterium]|nr:5'-methylthioadenosine/S-adenosylhomocysteine nucleosidase [Vicinamibacterales bacterium]